MIEIRNATKSFNSEKAVDELSLKIKKGIIFGFMGPNGAGKTTTIKMLVGLNRPSSGNIFIEGKTPDNRALREIIGFMPESPYFYDHLTGLEFLNFCAALFEKSDKSKSAHEALLREVGLYDARNKNISAYSKGMKQRLGFAQAIVHNPEYVFLDEPLDGLDPIGRRELKKMIFDLKEKGKTIFFNSHILFDAEELCDEIGVLHKGKLLYSGPVGKFTEGKRSLEEAFVQTIEKIK